MNNITSTVCAVVLLFSSSAFSASLPPLPPLLAPGLPPMLPVPDAGAGFRTYGAGLPLSDFVRITVGDVLGKPYVLTPSASAETALISADLKRVKAPQLQVVLVQVLEAAGFSYREVSGIVIIDRLVPKKVEERSLTRQRLIYRPKNRSVGVLASYFPMFPLLKFAFGAGISTKNLAPAEGAAGSSSNGSIGSSFSTGATTFSQANGDPEVLVAEGEPKDLSEFSALLAEVDTPVKEVLVRAYILEVRSVDSTQSGISLAVSILNDSLKLSLGSPQALGDSLKVSLHGNSLTAAIGALQGDSRVRLISAPVLRAADSSKATSAIGTETPTLGSVTTTNGQSTQSITYQSAGVLLSVAPRIYADTIRLQVSQEVSSFVATETGIKATPTKLRRAFNSDVVSRSGDVLLLGGLSDSSSAEANTRSFFGFGSKSHDVSTSDIVVLMSVELL